MERRESPPSPTTMVAGNCKFTTVPRWMLFEGRLCGGSKRLTKPPRLCLQMLPLRLVCALYSLLTFSVPSMPLVLWFSLFPHPFSDLACGALLTLPPSSPLGVRGWFIWPVLVTALFLIISAIWAVLSRQASPQLNR